MGIKASILVSVTGIMASFLYIIASFSVVIKFYYIKFECLLTVSPIKLSTVELCYNEIDGTEQKSSLGLVIAEVLIFTGK